MNSRVIAKKPAVMWAMNAYSILDRLSQEEEAEEEDANSKKQPSSTWSTDDDFKAVDGMEKEKKDANESELNENEPMASSGRKEEREGECVF